MILPLECDGIVEEEVWSTTENVGDGLLEKAPV